MQNNEKRQGDDKSWEPAFGIKAAEKPTEPTEPAESAHQKKAIEYKKSPNSATYR
jgi:hypothetical protein